MNDQIAKDKPASDVTVLSALETNGCEDEEQKKLEPTSTSKVANNESGNQQTEKTVSENKQPKFEDNSCEKKEIECGNHITTVEKDESENKESRVKSGNNVGDACQIKAGNEPQTSSIVASSTESISQETENGSEAKQAVKSESLSATSTEKIELNNSLEQNNTSETDMSCSQNSNQKLDDSDKRECEDKRDAVFVEDEAFNNIMSSLDDVINEVQGESEDDGLNDDCGNLITLDEAGSDEGNEPDDRQSTNDAVYQKELKELENMQENIPAEADVEIIPHPYSYIIDTLQITPDDCQFSALYDIPPLGQNEGFIYSKDALMMLMNILRNETEIALEVHTNAKTYSPIVSTLSISTKRSDFIIDVLQLKTDVLVLTEIFLNPRIVKVVTNLDAIKSKLYDLNLFLVNVFCLETAEKAIVNAPIKRSHFYLKLKHEYNFKMTFLSKSTCLLTRPLTQDLLTHMYSTTHFLLHIYLNQKNFLLSKDVELYKNVVNSCNAASKTITKENSQLGEAFRTVLPDFKARQKCGLLVCIRLIRWREECAKSRNLTPTTLLSDALLKKISTDLPYKPGGVALLTKNNEFIVNHIPEIAKIVLETKLELNYKVPSPPSNPHPISPAQPKVSMRKPHEPFDTMSKRSERKLAKKAHNTHSYKPKMNPKKPKMQPFIQQAKSQQTKSSVYQTQNQNNQIKAILNQNQAYINSHNEAVQKQMLQNQALQNMAMQNQAFARDRLSFASSSTATSSTNPNRNTQEQMIKEAVFNTALELLKQNRPNSAGQMASPSVANPNFVTATNSINPNRHPMMSQKPALTSLDQQYIALQNMMAKRQPPQQPPQPPSPPRYSHSRKSSSRYSRSRSRSPSYSRRRSRSRSPSRSRGGYRGSRPNRGRARGRSSRKPHY